MRISIRVKELFPCIRQYMKRKYGIKDEIQLEYTSKTTFLTFDTPDNNVEDEVNNDEIEREKRI